MSFVTRVTRLFGADSLAAGGSDAALFRSLATIQDELDLCRTLGKTDSARTFVKRRLGYVVKAFNLHRAVSA